MTKMKIQDREVEKACEPKSRGRKRKREENESIGEFETKTKKIKRKIEELNSNFQYKPQGVRNIELQNCSKHFSEDPKFNKFFKTTPSSKTGLDLIIRTLGKMKLEDKNEISGREEGHTLKILKIELKGGKSEEKLKT